MSVGKGMIHIPEGMVTPWTSSISPNSNQQKHKIAMGPGSGQAVNVPQKLERCTRDELISYLHTLSAQYTQLISKVKETLLKRNESTSAGIIIADSPFASEGMLAVISSSIRKDLERVGFQLFLMDVSYALQNRVELVLWSDLFKVPLDVCGHLCREMRDARDQQQQYLAKSALLDLASHFYLRVMDSICLVYNTSLKTVSTLFIPCNSKNVIRAPYEMLTRRTTLDWPPGTGLTCSPLYEDLSPNSHPILDKRSPESLSAVRNLLQHCILHLGDVARYRNSMEHAARLYTAALHLNPGNGHAYNQLGLLPSTSLLSRNTNILSKQDPVSLNHLHWWYHSVRALHCSSPFLKAESNLRDLAQKVLNGAAAPTTPPLAGNLHSLLVFHSHLLLGKGFLAAKQIWDGFLTGLTTFTFNISQTNFNQVVVIHLSQLANVLKQINHLSEVSSALEEALETSVPMKLCLSPNDSECLPLSPHLKWPRMQPPTSTVNGDPTVSSSNSSTEVTNHSRTILTLLLLLQAHASLIRNLCHLACKFLNNYKTTENPNENGDENGLFDTILSALTLLLFVHRELRVLYTVPNSHIWNMFTFHDAALRLLNQCLFKFNITSITQLKTVLNSVESEDLLKKKAQTLPEIAALEGFLPLNLTMSLPVINLTDNQGNLDPFSLEGIVSHPTLQSSSSHDSLTTNSYTEIRCLILLQCLRLCGLCRFRVIKEGSDSAVNELVEPLPLMKPVPQPVIELVHLKSPLPLNDASSSFRPTSDAKSHPTFLTNKTAVITSPNTYLPPPLATTVKAPQPYGKRQNVVLNSFKTGGVAIHSPVTNEFMKPVAAAGANYEASSFTNASPSSFSHLTNKLFSDSPLVDSLGKHTETDSLTPLMPVNHLAHLITLDDKGNIKSHNSNNQFSKELPPRFQRLAAQQANLRSFQGPFQATVTGDIGMMDLSKKESELEESVLNATANVQQLSSPLTNTDSKSNDVSSPFSVPSQTFPHSFGERLPPPAFMASVPPPPLPLPMSMNPPTSFRHPPSTMLSPSSLSSGEATFSDLISRPPPSLLPTPFMQSFRQSTNLSVSNQPIDANPSHYNLHRLPNSSSSSSSTIPSLIDGPLFQLYQQQQANRASTKQQKSRGNKEEYDSNRNTKHNPPL